MRRKNFGYIYLPQNIIYTLRWNIFRSLIKKCSQPSEQLALSFTGPDSDIITLKTSMFRSLAWMNFCEGQSDLNNFFLGEKIKIPFPWSNLCVQTIIFNHCTGKFARIWRRSKDSDNHVRSSDASSRIILSNSGIQWDPCKAYQRNVLVLISQTSPHR